MVLGNEQAIYRGTNHVPLLASRCPVEDYNVPMGAQLNPTLDRRGLAHMASRGAGPRYSLEGRRAVYLRADLDAWAAAQAYETAAVLQLKAMRGQLRSSFRERRDRGWALQD